MILFRNKVYHGANDRTALYDLSIPENAKAVIVFAHGYKGFKDWGTFSFWHSFFAQQHIAFLRFNFSHNGIGLEQLGEFTDLDAFAENRLSYEVEDFNLILNDLSIFEALDDVPVALMGHSKGGGIAQIVASKRSNIDKLILFASISDFDLRFPWDKDVWKNEGVVEIVNARTKQVMQHNYSFYQDYIDHKEDFDLKHCRKAIKCPVFVVQGEIDPAVPVWEAETIASECENSELKIYPDADHVFGAQHPYVENTLPQPIQELLSDVCAFILN